MQDKDYSELADKGWQNMASILDKEMPVKKNRRWLLVLLLFLTIGIGATAGYYWQEHSPKDAMYSVSATEAIASSPQAGATLAPPSIPARSSIEESLTKMDNETPIEPISSLAAASNSAPSTPYTEQEKQKLSAKKAHKIQRDIDHQAKSELAVINTFPKSNKETSVSGISKKDSALSLDSKARIDISKVLSPEQKSYIDVLTSLPISSSFLSSSLTERSFEAKKILEWSQRKPITLDFFAGYALPLASRIMGPYAGIAVGKKVSRRWSSSLGLGVMTSGVELFSGLTREEDQVFEVNSNIGFDPSMDVNQVGSPVSGQHEDGRVAEEYYDFIVDKVKQLTYLDLSLSARYTIARRHEVGGGLVYGYLVRARNEYISFSELEASLSVNNGGYAKDALIESNLFNRHNISASGSYRYSLGRNIGLTAKANLGLNKIIKSEGPSDSRNNLNYIGLGMDYRLQM